MPEQYDFWAELFRNDQASMWLGLACWLLALAVVLIIVLVLAFGRRRHANGLSSGRVYSRRREMEARPKRLLDDKYYHSSFEDKRKI